MIEGSLEGWIMVSISSLSCVLGASIVVLLGNSKIISSKRFLSASMALGGGVLIFNSLYTLLPASQQKLNSNFITYLCFFAGVLFTLLLTFTIQSCTPYAIHTCDPIAIVQQKNTQETPIIPHHHHTSTIEYGTITNNDQVLTTEKNDYFLIGMQTAIAICIHKFPG